MELVHDSRSCPTPVAFPVAMLMNYRTHFNIEGLSGQLVTHGTLPCTGRSHDATI